MQAVPSVSDLSALRMVIAAVVEENVRPIFGCSWCEECTIKSSWINAVRQLEVGCVKKSRARNNSAKKPGIFPNCPQTVLPITGGKCATQETYNSPYSNLQVNKIEPSWAPKSAHIKYSQAIHPVIAEGLCSIGELNDEASFLDAFLQIAYCAPPLFCSS